MASEQRSFPCHFCGGEVEFSPGSSTLVCPYCNGSNSISRSAEEIEELSYLDHLQQAGASGETEERLTIRCTACGAESTLEANVTSGECAFCGTNVVLTTQSRRLLKPGSLLPFKVEREQALDAFRRWVKSRWFAPNKLQRIAATAKAITGVYLPFWTYDCRTTSRYHGKRGDDYQVSESYSTTENGRSVNRTRQVTRTDWTLVSGVVTGSFDDLLVTASDSLPNTYVNSLEPWDLDQLVPYSDDYLAGFRAESYKVDLEQGFTVAKTTIDQRIRRLVARDIGGDHQQIDSVATRYDDIRFKHLLLPVWLSAYRFGDRVFRFLVNARTGEVQGERPYSWIKISLAILTALAVAGVVAWLN